MLFIEHETRHKIYLLFAVSIPDVKNGKTGTTLSDALSCACSNDQRFKYFYGNIRDVSIFLVFSLG